MAPDDYLDELCVSQKKINDAAKNDFYIDINLLNLLGYRNFESRRDIIDRWTSDITNTTSSTVAADSITSTNYGDVIW